MALLGHAAVEARGLFVVLLDERALFAHQRQIELRLGYALVSGQAEPARRLLAVLQDALALLKHAAQVKRRLEVVLLRGDGSIPSRVIVLLVFRAPGRQFLRRLGVALVGGELEVACCLRRVVAHADVVSCIEVAPVGG